jgi:hypothetical protein
MNYNGKRKRATLSEEFEFTIEERVKVRNSVFILEMFFLSFRFSPKWSRNKTFKKIVHWSWNILVNVQNYFIKHVNGKVTSINCNHPILIDIDVLEALEDFNIIESSIQLNDSFKVMQL